MKKKLPWLLPFLIFSLQAFSQTSTRNVVASTGGSTQVGNLLVQYTIGEPAVSSLQYGSLLLTQGFQQPELVVSNMVIPAVANLKVYPNPAVGKTKVDFDLLSDAKVMINLVNNAGQIVHSSYVTSLAGKIEYVLPLNGLASGIYHVVLYVNFRTFSEKLIIQ